MDSGELLARITQMRDASTVLRNSAHRIDEIMARVDIQIAALDTERFTGVAADQFRSEYQRLTPILRDAYHKIWMFQDKLTLSADDIEAAARPIE